MRVRESDYGDLDGRRTTSVNIERTIPLWGLICAIFAILAQGVLVWNAQEKQAIQMENQATSINRMSAELSSLHARQNTKDTKDMEQDLRLGEYSRRLLLVEGAPAARQSTPQR